MKMSVDRRFSCIPQLALTVACLFLSGAALLADITVEPWAPIFKGVEQASGKMTPVNGDPKLQLVYAVKIDLHDPDIRLLTTPPSTNYVADSDETKGQTVSDFLEKNHLQVAVNANVYFPSDPNKPGEPSVVRGIQISEGRVVSAQESLTDSVGLFFTSDNVPRLVPTNFPAISNDGFFTAIAGRYPLVRNGVNVGNNATSPSPGYDPRTSIGLTEDERYLILMVIDGRQPTSGGSQDEQTAAWLIRFGAYNAISMDGGGSTTLVKSDILGNSLRINNPSYLLTPARRERYIGSHFGVYAKPLQEFISNVAISSSGGVAQIDWSTTTEAICQVDYGPTSSYGASTPLETTPSTQHSVTLSGLPSGVVTYFQIRANSEGKDYSIASSLIVTNVELPIFGFDQHWRFQTNNLDGVNWTTNNYNDTKWLGEGAGLLYVEDNPDVGPKGTLLPPFHTTPVPDLPITYYFRTHFTYTNAVMPSSLTFSNFIDDGAVFYLNGFEVQRVRMPDFPEAITWETLALGFSCTGDATCPTDFSVAGDALSHLVRGDNVLAVEVHNYNPGSPDIVFGCALSYSPGQGPIEAPPTITTQPKPQTVTVGSSATFGVLASGSGSLSYQWLRNGSPVTGATGPTLTLNSVTPDLAGGYAVMVINAGGVVTSETALLTVLPLTLPTIRWVSSGTGWQLLWDDASFVLQSSPTLTGEPIPWTDVPGPNNTSPFTLSTSSTSSAQFFRLRK